MVATEFRNPEETQINSVSSASRDPTSVNMTKESPDSDVMRLRVSIGGTFSQVSDLK